MTAPHSQGETRAGTGTGGTGGTGTGGTGTGTGTGASVGGRYGEDLFGRYGEDGSEPEHPGETERIDAGALVYDPVTTRRLRTLGAGSGWRCLEVGAGTGTVARWLVEEAGVDEVVALDRDTSALAALAGPRLRAFAADLADETLSPGGFDLVHARFVLMHLPERRRLISRLAGWLDPGGWLVLGDAVEVPDALDTSSAYRRTMDAMWEALRTTIGTDISCVPAYPHFLRDEGLRNVAAELYCPPLVAGGPAVRFWSETWSRMRPQLEAAGRGHADVLDEALAYLASPELAELGPGMAMAWGQRAEH